MNGDPICLGSADWGRTTGEWSSSLGRARRVTSLGKDVVDDVAVDVGQTKIATGVAVGQSCVVDSQ